MNIVLTQSEDLFPIPTAPAVIQCRVACARTHLSCGQGGKVYVCPFLLNGLTVCASHTASVIEGVFNLALRAMCR